MPVARTKTNIQRTILILLGILLAGLLTINAKTLYTSEGFLEKKSISTEKVVSNQISTERVYTKAFKSFVEKITSLK